MPLFYFAMELLFRLGVGGRLGFGSGSLCGGFLGRSRSFLDRGFLSRSFLCGNLFCRSFRDFLDRLGDLFLRVDNSDTVVCGVGLSRGTLHNRQSQNAHVAAVEYFNRLTILKLFLVLGLDGDYLELNERFGKFNAAQLLAVRKGCFAELLKLLGKFDLGKLLASCKRVLFNDLKLALIVEADAYELLKAAERIRTDGLDMLLDNDVLDIVRICAQGAALSAS